MIAVTDGNRHVYYIDIILYTSSSVVYCPRCEYTEKCIQYSTYTGKCRTRLTTKDGGTVAVISMTKTHTLLVMIRND